MNRFQPIVFASLLILAVPAFAQSAHMHQEPMQAAPAAMQDVPDIAPAAAGKGGCEKCKTMGAGDKMASGGEMGGMGCCKSRQASSKGGEKCASMGGKMAHGGGAGCCGGSGDAAALERRVSELEKQLALLQQSRKTR